MNRRGFLKNAGIRSAVLVGVPSILTSAASPSVGFRFVSNSRTATIGGARHLFMMNGDGKITESQVEGGGSINHVLDTSPVPKTLVGSGTWKAKDLTGFTLLGTYGALAAGIVDMVIHVVPTGGSVFEAKLRVISNLAPAGIFTGQEEGFVFDIPGTPFTVGGIFGPAQPYIPVPGGPTDGHAFLTLLNEQRD